VTAYGYSQNVPSGILSTLGNYNTVSGDGEGSRQMQPLLEIRISKYPPAEPGALDTGPLKAACWGR